MPKWHNKVQQTKPTSFSCESDSSLLRAGFDLIELSGYGRQSTGSANPRREVSVLFAYNFGEGPCSYSERAPPSARPGNGFRLVRLSGIDRIAAPAPSAGRGSGGPDE